VARDPSHWLWRLSAPEWLAAADTEIAQAQSRLSSRRAAVTHARRAAGMALNAVLVAQAERGWSDQRCESAWGRSYIDHVRALGRAKDEAAREPFDARMSEACAALLDIGVMPAGSGGLVSLSRERDEPQREALELAASIRRACAELCAETPSSPGC